MNYTLDTGDAIRMHRIFDRHCDARGKLLTEVSWNAPKGETFILLVIGTEKMGAKPDTEAMLNKLGWHFRPELTESRAPHAGTPEAG